MIDPFSLVGEAAGKLSFFTIRALGLLTVATNLAASTLVAGWFRGIGMSILSGRARCCWESSIFAMIVVVVGRIIIGAVAVIVVEPALVRRRLVVHDIITIIIIIIGSSLGVLNSSIKKVKVRYLG